MTESAETPEAPNWLSELEKKREIRLKARLGHEAGAGAPCIQCNEKCPGLDLHFWRKICKNCKCSKEDHDVHDDDIYGWAQFQLLGSKPNRIKKKIVLPGKKEVELEWAPSGNNETVDQYLKTLAPESLPVKGSQAAQDRKQLLQKQIPIHDIDPSLCHELSESELAKFNDYVKHMKNSAGQGQIIQFHINYGKKHEFGETDRKVVANRYPKGVSAVETVQLTTAGVTKHLDKLAIRDQKELDAFFDKIPKPHNMTAQTENLGYGAPEQYHLSGQLPQKTGKLGYIDNSEKLGYVDPTSKLQYIDPVYDNPEINHNKKLGYDPQNPEINQNKKLGYVDPANYNAVGYPKTPLIHSEDVSRQSREINHNKNVGYVGNLGYQGYGGPPGETNYNVKVGLGEVNQNDLDLATAAEKYWFVPPPGLEDLPPPPPPPEEELERSFANAPPLAATPVAANEINRNYKLPALNPHQLSVSESRLLPDPVKVGAIRDITYETPEVKTATQAENALYEGLTPSGDIPEGVEIQTKQCRKCAKFFKEGEFAIFVEKNNSLYHSKCFRCAGCSQNLADLLYFYDKESDDIYCGRDFAKIRGIPRCRACDELIFVKEYCLAENSTFHLKHFCCFECDQALAGQNYVVEDSQPVCLPCFEKLKANKCISCAKVIRPDEQGVSLAEGIHFHAADECFCCSVCKKVLHGAKLLFRNRKLYCSHDCFRTDQ